MNINFYKYQGTGNDFIMIDNRAKTFPKEINIITHLCNRNFGIGADGLILLEEDADTDFRMVYYNSDGNESSMCGNGGRCIVAFAHKLGIFENKTTFIATDGVHHAEMLENYTPFSSLPQKVSLQMIDVFSIRFKDGYAFLNTGSPHHVELVDDIEKVDVFNEGKRIRNEIYGTEGSNVNFVQKTTSLCFRIRTYERGVEDETLACGTGATAAAIALHASGIINKNCIDIITKGGNLAVSFDVENNIYKNVHLIGTAIFVFSGEIEV